MADKMQLIGLNSDYEPVWIMDNLNSVTWAEYYHGSGAVDITVPDTEDNFKMALGIKWIYNTLSPNLMMVSKITSNLGYNENELSIDGCSLEYLFNFRVLMEQYTAEDKSIIEIIQDIVEQNCGSDTTLIVPSELAQERAIPNIEVIDCTSNISDETLEYCEENLCSVAYSPGTTVAEILDELCETMDLGYRLVRRYASSNDETYEDFGSWKFELYEGSNLCRENDDDNTPVVFSHDFDNLEEYEYSRDMLPIPTDAILKGKYDSDDIYVTLYASSSTGIDRVETSYDYSSDTDSSGYTQSAYLDLLNELGEDDIEAEYQEETLEATIADDIMYSVNEDYYLGDIVEIQTNSGIHAAATINGILYSQDESGTRVSPEFDIAIDQHTKLDVYEDYEMTSGQYVNMIYFEVPEGSTVRGKLQYAICDSDEATVQEWPSEFGSDHDEWDFVTESNSIKYTPYTSSSSIPKFKMEGTALSNNSIIIPYGNNHDSTYQLNSGVADTYSFMSRFTGALKTNSDGDPVIITHIQYWTGSAWSEFVYNLYEDGSVTTNG